MQPPRHLVGDILRISTAVGIAQVIAIAATPLLTRLYEPDAFGHLGLFHAAIQLLMPFAVLRYEWAIPLPADKSIALDLLGLCLILPFASSLAVALIAPMAWPIFREWTWVGSEDLVLLALGICVLGLHAVVTGWLARDQAFAQVAIVRFATAVGGIAAQLGLSPFAAGPRTLIVGSIGGYFVGLLLGAYHCRSAIAESVVRIRLIRLRRVAAEYRRFALISAPSSIVNGAGLTLPTILLPSLYGLSITGQYSLAQRVLSQPVVLVGQAVFQVFWVNAARLFQDDPIRLWPLFLRLNVSLTAVMTPCLILTWLGPSIFAFVFGPAWTEAGRFAGVMVIASFFGLAAQCTSALEVYRLNHWMAAWEFTRLILVVSALGVAASAMLSPTMCIVAITLAFTISNVVLLGLNTLVVWQVKRRAEGPRRYEVTSTFLSRRATEQRCEPQDTTSI